MERDICVAMIEDNDDVADYTRGLLATAAGFEFVGRWPAARAGVAGILEVRPDLAIIDLGLPDLHGSECIRQLHADLPELKIVAFTIIEDESSIIEAIRAGANGYLLKDTPEDLLLLELEVVMKGGSSLTPRVAHRLAGVFAARQAIANPLTERESEVLHLLALGYNYKDIAHEMDISTHTVRSFIEKIYRKLDVHSKSEAIIKGRRQGLLSRLFD